MTADIKVPFGMRADNRRIVSVQSVVRGLACDCICPECQVSLVAVKGEKLQHHFRHHSDHCGGGRETAMHKFAKQIICDELSVFFPDGYSFGAMLSAEQEISLGDLRPDVLAHFGDEDVAIEIHVTHPVPKSKIELIHARGLCTLEIDLSRYWDSINLDEDRFKSIVLHSAQRRWVYPPLSVRQAQAAELAAREEAKRKAEMEEMMRLKEAELARMEEDIIRAGKEAKTEADKELMREAWHKVRAEEEAEKEKFRAEIAERQRVELYARAQQEALEKAEAEWMALEKQSPNLQELVAAHGSYDKITAEAWQRFDRDTERWKMALRHGDHYWRSSNEKT